MTVQFTPAVNLCMKRSLGAQQMFKAAAARWEAGIHRGGTATTVGTKLLVGAESIHSCFENQMLRSQAHFSDAFVIFCNSALVVQM